MGNALRSHDNLVYVRGWTSGHIATLHDTLRKKQVIYALTREDYARFVAGKSSEAGPIFTDLDDDFDGKVDVFEVLVLITLWSGTPWHEKKELLFLIFDMMGKGFLKADELFFMVSVLERVVSKFVHIQKDYGNLTDVARKAFEVVKAKQLKILEFRQWLDSCQPFEDLKVFLEDHSGRARADFNDTRLQQEYRTIETHTLKLFDRIEKLHDRLPVFADDCSDYINAWGRRKRWDFVMQNLRQMLMDLNSVSESMHLKLAFLGEMLHEDEHSGGMASLIQPRRRFEQEHVILELSQMRTQSREQYGKVVTFLERLVEIAEPAEPGLCTHIALDSTESPALEELDNEDAQDADGISLTAQNAPTDAVKRMKLLCTDMHNDLSEDGIFGMPNLKTMLNKIKAETPDFEGLSDVDGEVEAVVRAGGASLAGGRGAADARAGSSKTLTVIADFTPPPSHEAQMLKLSIGEHVVVLGQDGRGWWYGRKVETDREGWFPPSYVHSNAAHYSSAGNAISGKSGTQGGSKAAQTQS